jgi:alpha-beta hydrolase superfamily lysophospholipase
MDETTFTLGTDDGLELVGYRWSPDGAPRAAVQLQHGLAEHAARYRRLAETLTDHGYVVYAPDGRGSGRSAERAGAGFGAWGPAGWPGWVGDLATLNDRIREEQPGLPVLLLGHSMGSFASQQYLLDHSGDVAAVVLSGTTSVDGLVPVLASDEPADLSGFNAGFEPRTGYEWLSRDEAEVDAYVADPACGWTAPPLPEITTLLAAADPERLAGIRPDLPVLLISGDADPLAGGGEAVQTVAQRYRDAGLGDVTVRLYPAARHEVFNETNREEVTADVVAFFDRVTGREG